MIVAQSTEFEITFLGRELMLRIKFGFLKLVRTYVLGPILGRFWYFLARLCSKST